MCVFRYKFECAQVLRTLRFIIIALYKEQGSNKSLPGELMSLETVYEMMLSHSQFLDFILNADGKSNTRGNGLVLFAMSLIFCQFNWQNRAKPNYNIARL